VADDGDWGPMFLGGISRRTADEVMERIRVLADSVRSTAGRQIGALGAPVPVMGELAASMQRLVEGVPTPMAQLQLLLQEVKAKRAMVQAFHAQLESFDKQLEVLERSLAPMMEWGERWTSVQETVTDSLRVFRPGGGAEGR
jgi:hypothetical protein